MASVDPRIKAVAAYVPSGLVWQSQRRLNRATSSWAYKGQPVPFVPFKGNVNPKSGVIAELFEDSLEQTELVKAAQIAVEKINGPILLMSATRDQIWPSTKLSNIAMSRLTEFGFEHQYEHVAFHDGHGVGRSAADILRRIRRFFTTNF